jgi:hypothetical protein
MMAKEPGRRFQTPQEVAQALAPFLRKGNLAAQAPQPELSTGNGSMLQQRLGNTGPVPTQPVAQAPAPSVPQTPVPAQSGSAWDTLVEIREEGGLSEEVRALRESRRVPPWLWPAVAVGLFLVGIAVGWKLSVESMKPESGVPSHSVASSRGNVDRTKPPGTQAGVPRTPEKASPVPSDPRTTRVDPIVSAGNQTTVSKSASESPQTVAQDRQNDIKTAESNQLSSSKLDQVRSNVVPKPQPDAKQSPEDSSPEAILVRRGLKKAGRFYVVPTEYEALEGYKRVLPYWKRTEEAWTELRAAWEIEYLLQSLDDQRINLNFIIGNLNAELASLANSRLAQAPIYRQQLQNQLQAAQAELTEVNRQFAVAIKRRVSDAKKEELRGTFMKLRAEFFDESNKLKPIFDKVSLEYEEVKKDDAVTNAIKTLKEEKKAPISLGPSERCRQMFSEVKESQKLLSYNPDSFRGRKKPRLEQNPKGKTRSMSTSKAGESG